MKKFKLAQIFYLGRGFVNIKWHYAKHKYI